MNSLGDSRLTSAVFSRRLSLRLPDTLEVGIGLGIGEEIGYGAIEFVDITVRAQSITAAPAILVLQRVQFATASGLRKCAVWDS